jgi:peptidoglycan hydrolase FlgJ
MSAVLPAIGTTGTPDLPIVQPKKTAKPDKARAAAEDFEAVFLNSMFNHMFTGIDGEGPFGGGPGLGVWRSFLTDEYAKSFAKNGGIGIADHVYRTLLAQQEAHGPQPLRPDARPE